MLVTDIQLKVQVKNVKTIAFSIFSSRANGKHTTTYLIRTGVNKKANLLNTDETSRFFTAS